MADDTKPAKSREELVREKILAGLTREQALEVLNRQAEADMAGQGETATPAKKGGK